MHDPVAVNVVLSALVYSHSAVHGVSAATAFVLETQVLEVVSTSPEAHNDHLLVEGAVTATPLS